MAKEFAPYGTWPSDINAAMVAGQSIRFGSLQSSGDWVYWSESRPEEGGRGVIMRGRPGEDWAELLPAPYSARSRVHEYGGGEFLVAGGRIFFTNDKDQDIYVLEIGEPGVKPRRLTDEPDMRFADFAHDAKHDRLIAVTERQSQDDYPENLLVSIALGGEGGGAVEALVEGRDFYACPRVNPDGTKLCWMAWDLPDMPWDQASLHVAVLEDGGSLGEAEHIAGGDGVYVFQPEWSRSGDLFFVSDASGWGNLYRWDGESVRPIAPMAAECGRPHWVFGMRSFSENDKGQLGVAAFEGGALKFLTMGISAGAGADASAGDEGAPVTVGQELTSAETVNPYKDCFAAQVTKADMPAAIAVFGGAGGEIEFIRKSANVALSAGDISVAQIIAFEGEGGDQVYGQYYPPTNSKFEAPDGELPPVIIMVHGGPSGMAARGFQWKVQYWTSRGFAVFDVDYSGSTGYGRAYRERLDGQWGVRDVADVVGGGHFLVKAGLADPERLLISGGSAGGYGVLMALAMSDIFAAGGCYYGISDLVQLLKFTHKFESGYTYRLTGTTPDDYQTVLTERSPLSHIENMTSPLIVFQGLDDKVVPPPQSRMIVDGLKARNIEVEYHEFEGEGHGFRRAETIVTALEAELAFYRRVFER